MKTVKENIFRYVAELKSKYNLYALKAYYFKTLSGTNIISIEGVDFNENIDFAMDTMNFAMDFYEKNNEVIVFTSPEDNLYNDNCNEWFPIELDYHYNDAVYSQCDVKIILDSINFAYVNNNNYALAA